MKNIQINMSDIGFGADRLGIQHGYVMIKKYNMDLANSINYLKHEMVAEDFTIKPKYYNNVYNAALTIYNEHLKAYNENKFPVLLGGDHSLALGSVKASMKVHGDNIGVIWIDAHADINTFRGTNSGNIHGTPVASLLGINEEKFNTLGNDLKLKPENVVLFSTRDVEEDEFKNIDECNVLNISDEIIKKTSFEQQLEVAINHLKGKVSKVHISLDLDSMKPEKIKGVSTPVVGGLEPSEPLKIMERVNDEFELISIDIVEYNPLNDKDENTYRYVEQLIKDIKEI